jgi:transcription elongation factor Elf1
MECVVQVVRGQNLDEGDCTFCGKLSISTFCVTKGKKHDGTMISGFPICKEHHDKLNSLLSGEFDIDQIYLDRYKTSHTRKINVRR